MLETFFLRLFGFGALRFSAQDSRVWGFRASGRRVGGLGFKVWGVWGFRV